MIALSGPARSQSVLAELNEDWRCLCCGFASKCLHRFIAQIEQSNCRVPNSCPINRATAVTHGY